jgi:hypothetical protein
MKDQKLRNRTRGLFLLATSSLILSACGKSTNSVSSSPKGDSLSSGSSSSSVVTGQAKIWSAYNTENLMQDNSYDLSREPPRFPLTRQRVKAKARSSW